MNILHFTVVTVKTEQIVSKTYDIVQLKPSSIHFSRKSNPVWRPLQVSCPYKARKPRLVKTYLWHSPRKRRYVPSTTSVPVECHSMWKRPGHLIIKLIKPAHKIRCCRAWNLHTSSATAPCLVCAGPQKINIKHRQVLVYSDDGVWGWAMKQAWEARLATALYWCESVIHWVAYYAVQEEGSMWESYQRGC